MVAVRCIGVGSELTDSSTACRYDTQRSVLRLAWSSRCYGVIRCAPKSTTVLLLLLLLVLWILHYYYKYSYCKCRERELVLYYSQRVLHLSLLTESYHPVPQRASTLTTGREIVLHLLL